MASDPDIIAAMICPTCSSKAVAVAARVGKSRRPHKQPSLFVEYRCEQGHYFETISFFNGAYYEQHYVPATEKRLVVIASLN
jgi:hypothetical protein